MLQLAPADRPYRTKASLVYSTLRDAIMRCEIEPGARLIIDDISASLGVSHIPVREALNQLQSEGLVIVVPHAGATVTPVSPDDLTEIFSILEGLEIVATRVVAEHATPSDLAGLVALLAPMDDAVRNQQPNEWAELNIGFHRQIAQISGMPMLSEMLNRVLDLWDRVRRHMRVLPERMAEAQQEHHEIVSALMNGDAAAVQVLVTRHNRGALAAYQMRFATDS